MATSNPSASLVHARAMDRQDSLKDIRADFHIPQKKSFGKKIERLPNELDAPIIYLAGSAMGLQPRNVLQRTQSFLDQWASQCILAGFTSLPGSEIPSWIEAEDTVARLMTPIVGADSGEVVMMGTLTSNLHFLLAAFYRPADVDNQQRTDIIIEEGAFSSDRYAVESHIMLRGLDPTARMIEIPFDRSSGLLLAETIYATIEANAATTRVLLLSAVQFHTGQFLDVAGITKYARERGIVVGWDLAHAVGNVELSLHEWGVDFAVWCSYKYLNAGPGATAGAFVHKLHASSKRPRLAGWWGTPVSQRFALSKDFEPAEGARGYQLSSPSILDITAVTAALSIFDKIGMTLVAKKSRELTGFLEVLLSDLATTWCEKLGMLEGEDDLLWTIITPNDPKQRGAMLSLRWHQQELLDQVCASLRAASVIVDVRKPDIMRITPNPLYNTFEDVWHFSQELGAILITVIH